MFISFFLPWHYSFLQLSFTVQEFFNSFKYYKMIKTNKKISIVITTKNEENNIENCLKSIINQTFPRNLIEIIVMLDSTLRHNI